MHNDAKCFLDHVREEGLQYTAENRELSEPRLNALRIAYLEAGQQLVEALRLAVDNRD